MGRNTKANTSSAGIQGMINKKFWGKKSLKPKGKALKKEEIEKKAGQGAVEEVLEDD